MVQTRFASCNPKNPINPSFKCIIVAINNYGLRYTVNQHRRGLLITNYLTFNC